MVEKMKKPEDKRFQIHNMTRSQETRKGRVAVTRERSRTVLMLGGGSIRVMRNRPLPVTESTVRRLHAELVSKVNIGAAKVTTATGELVDIKTLKPVAPAPKGVEGPKPHPKLDSVADDIPAGNKMPQMLGGVPEGVSMPTPAVGEQAIPDGEEPFDEPTSEEKSSPGKRYRRKKG
jgi:hypothetical protein